MSVRLRSSSVWQGRPSGQYLPRPYAASIDATSLVTRGLPADEVARVIGLVDGAEHKRRQAPPGVRVTTRAFGRDRRLPITNRYGG